MKNESVLHNLSTRLRQKQAREASGFEPRIERVIGTVFAVNDSIYVPGRGNSIVHVLAWATTAAAAVAKTNGIGVADGVMVWMTREVTESIYTIERLYDGILKPEYGSQASAYNIGKHAPRHQWPTEQNKGDDAVSIYEPAMQPGKLLPYSGLTVFIERFTYYQSDQILQSYETTLDLTSSLPSAGNQRFVLVYFDPSNATMNVVNGTQVTDIPILIPDEPAAVLQTYPLGMVLLRNTTTDIVETDIYPARSFLSPIGTIGIGLATEAGQMLFADENLQWVPGKIVTSGGDVVVSGGDVVWSPS